MTKVKQLPNELHRDDLYCYSFSVDQRAGHVDMLWHDLEVNLSQVVTSSTNDYKILYIGTREECREFSEKFEEKFFEENPKI